MAADSVYHSFNYRMIQSEPVLWEPEQGIYYNSIKVELKTDSGKLYYFTGKSLAETEPVPYESDLFLSGEKNRIVDYHVYVMLEKSDGRVELYSRVYRIDRQDRFQNRTETLFSGYQENRTISGNEIQSDLKFSQNIYAVVSEHRKVSYPFPVKGQSALITRKVIKGQKNSDNFFMTTLAYRDQTVNRVKILNHSINLEETKPPSFGSLYWGQTYKQAYYLKIKPWLETDKIFYWYRERKKEELLFSYPSIEDRSKWIEYTGPIELKSQYGSQGTSAIAAFSVGKNNLASKVNGPYYFKINGIDKEFEQVFPEDTIEKFKGKVYLNNLDVSGDQWLKANGEAVVRFQSFHREDTFSIKLKSQKAEGDSEYFACSGEYTFVNHSENEVLQYELTASNGSLLARFQLNPTQMLLPVPEKYSGNRIDLSSDELIRFRMPEFKVRYEITDKIHQYLSIAGNSKEFTGEINAAVPAGQDITYKIKFGSFDVKDNLIAESDFYYIRIDKKSPMRDVSADGIDFELFHNEMQKVKLTVNDPESRIYYRMNTQENWIPYDEPVLLYPPDTGVYSIQIFAKSVDKVGNERENKNPFEIKFDRRAIFVDSKRKYSGNGSESSPCNSIERALNFARSKNIRLIFLLSDEYRLSSPLSINSDIIIQPYQSDLTPKFFMETRSVFKKNHVWFDVLSSGYLEFRKINFLINSGNVFGRINGSKLKIYHTDLLYNGSNPFTFFINEKGKLGLLNLAVNVTADNGGITFSEIQNGQLILKHFNGRIRTDQFKFAEIKNSNEVVMENINLENFSRIKSGILQITNSSLKADRFIYRQTGTFTQSSLIQNQNSLLDFDHSDFIVTGSKPFEIQILDQNQSKSSFRNSLFRIIKSNSVIGFNVRNGELEFDRSLIDIREIEDYTYCFRAEKSKIYFYSSIIRNYQARSAVSFMLNNSQYFGSNNSVFNTRIIDDNFAFWVNQKGEINSVNSLYYFKNSSAKNQFIYLNHEDYDSIKPVLLSNALSAGVTLLENLNRKEDENLINQYAEANLIYEIGNEFDMESSDFFIPMEDSPLLQGGIDNQKSPVKIQELDFNGKNRLISGIGIDIGAVQVSGYEESEE